MPDWAFPIIEHAHPLTRPKMLSFSRRSLMSLAAAAFAIACGRDMTTNPANPVAANAVSARSSEQDGREGAVYTATNATSGNAIVAFHRAADGALSPIGTFATGGAGTGGTIDPLTSQYSLVLDDKHVLLFAVNAGSNDISTFKIEHDGSLSSPRTTSSGGNYPVSLATHGDLLYVLNAGSKTLQGYRVSGSASLIALPHAQVELPAGASGPAAIRFTRDGKNLLVTERGSNRIDLFAVKENGRLASVGTFASHGGAAFGFDVTPSNTIVVSETGSNAPNGGVSSYTLHGRTLSLASGSINSGGAAACWLLATRDGRFSYVINAGGASIGAFAVSRDGSIASIGGDEALTSTGAGSTPLDPAFSSDDRFLYVLEGGSGNVAGFSVARDGALAPVTAAHAGAGASGLQGLAAY
jgi:6-phosphogluconolactonase